ncbi:hypothetical protein [Cupriavidus taiwanensis]|uniref:Uncharacterized protein n=1 Tax=Cupriavidus taiwanensis TaxID=164546 RepID=A0A7Z7JFM1_9BURK|nr:hypothetical protein [Cupriavidus taiwanensis]SOZ17329.1 hypothetical protein CBM2597_U10180 [Cupriavidus taiwanensis]SOZ96363.1 hypothetical protein CBM2598_U10171 [Cupriavidus taiwanensis]SPC25686.1 hypothetical protein CBM2594_U10187 [Cupriavidus taiwanensis]
MNASATIAKTKYLSMIADLAGERASSLLLLANQAMGSVDLVGTHSDSEVATLRLSGDVIEFSCYLGVHGTIYPRFALDAGSRTHSLTGQPYTEDSVIRLLRTCIRSASALRIEDDSSLFDPEDETFIVDPALEEELHEVHNT